MTPNQIASHQMPTSLRGRLRNTSLPKTKALLPLFEAIVNSIHAIDDAQLSSAAGHIAIHVIRSPQFEFDDTKTTSGIVGFRVTDNGIGFDKSNMDSFRVLDSDYKIERGGRGIGRLLWLKAFRIVHVESTFVDHDGHTRRRCFKFSADRGVYDDEISSSTLDTGPSTTVHLDGFEEKYRPQSRTTPTALAHHVLEHCLWYYIRDEGAPKICIVDGEETLYLDRVYDRHVSSLSSPESVSIKGWDFHLSHIRTRGNLSSTHTVSWCADTRVVMTERLTGKIPGLYGNVSDEEGAFVYWCYVSSRFFDEHVRPERTGFDAIERRDELFSASELSLDDVRDTVLERAESHLSTVLSKNRLRSRERIMRFVAQQAPKYRFLLSRVPDRDLNIDPEITDKELELALHRHYADLERKLLRDGQDVIRAVEGGQEREYQERLAEYMSNVEEFKMSDLASYVTHRRVTIELFEKAIEKRPDGTYAHEELIHSLIMSRGSDSDEISLRNCNLWLIDERLSFHHYLSSDKPIGSMPITGSDSRKRPDICALRILDDPVLVSPGKMPHASLDIIEIKRPMRADVGAGKEYDPIEQAIGYLRRIRVGKVFTAHGRAISSSKTLPGFCYIIADLTENLRVRCEDHHDLQVTSDGLGYFGYKSNVNAYIEVTSFDRVVQRAKERNRAFFDQLGLPVT